MLKFTLKSLISLQLNKKNTSEVRIEFMNSEIWEFRNPEIKESRNSEPKNCRKKLRNEEIQIVRQIR